MKKKVNLSKFKYIHRNVESIVFYKESDRYGFGVGVGFGGTIVKTYFSNFNTYGYYDETKIKRFYI